MIGTFDSSTCTTYVSGLLQGAGYSSVGLLCPINMGVRHYYGVYE